MCSPGRKIRLENRSSRSPSKHWKWLCKRLSRPFLVYKVRMRITRVTMRNTLSRMMSEWLFLCLFYTLESEPETVTKRSSLVFPPVSVIMFFWHTELGSPGGASGKESACQCRRCKRCRLDPWVGKDVLEWEMAAHCSGLAWRIPRTAEAGGLQSMGPQRIRQDWAHTRGTQMCHWLVSCLHAAVAGLSAHSRNCSLQSLECLWSTWSPNIYFDWGKFSYIAWKRYKAAFRKFCTVYCT